MSYEAIICKITNLKPIPNADFLLTGKASGYSVVVGKDIQEGTLGIFFPSDGQLTDDMCRINNLYRHTYLNEDKEAKGGFFEDNRRVKAITLRKCRSEGYWTELSILEWTGANISTLKEGDLISKLNGCSICSKYYTKSTQRAMASGQGKTSKKSLLKASFPDFKEHKDTQKLRMMLDFVPENAILSITEKVHGTSGRTGRVYQEIKLPWYKKAINALFGHPIPERIYKYVSGSRKVVIDPEEQDTGFYEGTNFRNTCHQMIRRMGLHPGETIYYEIVGYDDNGGSIMGSHGIEDKDLKKKYGDEMTYSYGCLADPQIEASETIDENGKTTISVKSTLPFRMLAYRMTRTLEDSSRSELSSEQLIARCKELGILMVPNLMGPFIYDGNKEKLMETCEKLSQGNSSLDIKHIKEGVVVRVEKEDIDCVYKYKSFHFCELEGIKKNTDDYVDLEEIS